MAGNWGSSEERRNDILETNVETWMMSDMDVFFLRLGSYTRKALILISHNAGPIKGRSRLAYKSNKVRSYQRTGFYFFVCDSIRRQNRDRIVSRPDLGQEKIDMAAK